MVFYRQGGEEAEKSYIARQSVCVRGRVFEEQFYSKQSMVSDTHYYKSQPRRIRRRKQWLLTLFNCRFILRAVRYLEIYNSNYFRLNLQSIHRVWFLFGDKLRSALDVSRRFKHSTAQTYVLNLLIASSHQVILLSLKNSCMYRKVVHAA